MRGDDELPLESETEQDREDRIHRKEYRCQRQISMRERDV
jgi:hypothetical protein